MSQTTKRSLSQLAVEKYPLRTCYSMHDCAVCGGTISLGQRYYDGGYGRRIHEACAAQGSASPTSPEPSQLEPAKRTKPMRLRPCAYCHQTDPPFSASLQGHVACIEAYGLDYDPSSELDARTWLDDRRHRFGQLPRWTKRAYAAIPGIGPRGRIVIVLVQEDRAGYQRCPEHGYFDMIDTASKQVRMLNRRLRIEQKEAARIVGSSMAAQNAVERSKGRRAQP